MTNSSSLSIVDIAAIVAAVFAGLTFLFGKVNWSKTWHRRHWITDWLVLTGSLAVALFGFEGFEGKSVRAAWIGLAMLVLAVVLAVDMYKRWNKERINPDKKD